MEANVDEELIPFDAELHAATANISTLNPSVRNPDDTLNPPLRYSADGDMPEKGVLDLPPIAGDVLHVCGDNGVSRWVTMARNKENDAAAEQADEVAEDLRRLERQAGVLSTVGIDLRVLRREAEEQRAAAAAEAAEASRRDELAEGGRQLRQPAVGSSRGDVAESLWVTKYSPTSFKDLLSDDSVNLKLLSWLKSWDPHVFPQRAAKAKRGPGAVTPVPAPEPGAPKQEKKTDPRPEERMILVVGPPGVGKTTLAHVAAKHCGYDPIEVNASMDRTVKAFEELLASVFASAAGSREGGSEDATTVDTSAAATSGGERNKKRLMRPKCLIIDEMDGIVANVVPVLLKKDLQRPVICLANNLYAPALRVLRQSVTTILHVPEVQPRMLLSRLEVVAETEGVAVDRPTLAELVHIGGGDIRCCLNTLQWLCRQAETSAGVSRLLRSVKGKDATLGLWTLWGDLFQRKERSKYASLLAKRMETPGSARDIGSTAITAEVLAKTSFDPGYLYFRDQLSQCADMDAFLSGAHQYYPQQRFSDFDGAKLADVADAFSRQDRLTTFGYNHQHLEVPNANANLVGLTTFASCSSLNRMSTKLQFPKEMSDLNTSTMASQAAIRTQLDTSTATVAANLPGVSGMATDVLPLMLRSLQPSFKIPANFTASSLWKNDRTEFTQLVERHVTYGLNYRRTMRFDWQTKEQKEAWALDPAVDDVVRFKRLRGTGTNAVVGVSTLMTKNSRVRGTKPRRATLAVSDRDDVRQVVVGEAQQLRILQRAEQAAQSSGRTGSATAAAAKDKTPGDPGKAARKENTPNAATGGKGHEAAASAAEPAEPVEPEKLVAATVKKDIFGRPIVPKAKKGMPGNAAGGAAGGVSAKPNARHFVKLAFLDGSSSAVKRPARLSDFL